MINEEATNTAQKVIMTIRPWLLIVYLIIWALCLGAFYFIKDDSGMGYAIHVFYITIPVFTFVVSFLFGAFDYGGKLKWLWPIFFRVYVYGFRICHIQTRSQQDAATEEIKVSFKQYIAYDKATVEKSKSSASSATDSNGKASNAAVKFLKGKWYSASCGEGGPNWYVVFTKKYAKRYMYDTKKKKYVYERKGIIKSTKKVASGYRIKIKDGKNKYTYQSAKDDKNVLDFYGTWKTSEFSSTYSGSSSLAR